MTRTPQDDRARPEDARPVLLRELADGGVRLWIDNPHQRNALTDEWWLAFRTVVEAVKRDESVATVRITGLGRAFSSGGDLSRMRAAVAAMTDGVAAPEFLAEERARHRAINDTILDWAMLPVVRLIGINGPAVGAGLALALSGDYRIMAESAWFDTGFAKVGLPGDGGITHYLTELLGPASARAWLLSPRRWSAGEALARGLVDEVVADHRLEGALREREAALASLSSVTRQHILARSTTKSVLGRRLQTELEGTTSAKATIEYARAVSAFFGTT